MPEIVPVRGCKSTLCHRQVVYGIQEICLSLPVVAADAVHVGRELQFLKLYVPEIRYYYFFKYRHIPSDVNMQI